GEEAGPGRRATRAAARGKDREVHRGLAEAGIRKALEGGRRQARRTRGQPAAQQGPDDDLALRILREKEKTGAERHVEDRPVRRRSEDARPGASQPRRADPRQQPEVPDLRRRDLADRAEDLARSGSDAGLVDLVELELGKDVIQPGSPRSRGPDRGRKEDPGGDQSEAGQRDSRRGASAADPEETERPYEREEAGGRRREPR